jgi:hypothetical protein
VTALGPYKPKRACGSTPYRPPTPQPGRCGTFEVNDVKDINEAAAARKRRPPNRQPSTVFLVKLLPRPGSDGIRTLRRLLKILDRYHHLRCIDAREERSAP